MQGQFLCPRRWTVALLKTWKSFQGLMQEVYYYFPNILSKALAPDEGDFLMDVLYFLGCTSEHTRNQISLFDKPQRQAVYRFLLYIQANRQEEVTDYMCGEELAQALKDWA